jgi:hypothetical protein
LKKAWRIQDCDEKDISISKNIPQFTRTMV